jgi:hypothetical protein
MRSEAHESTNRGIAIPTPNDKKIKKCVRASAAVSENVNKRRIGPGLQGSAINPKNPPNRKAER